MSDRIKAWAHWKQIELEKNFSDFPPEALESEKLFLEDVKNLLSLQSKLDEAADKYLQLAVKYDELSDKLIKMQSKLTIAVKALTDIDEWQGKQPCEASVYEIEDDEFGTLQHIVHQALDEIKKGEG